jgi:hypothetical protein
MAISSVSLQERFGILKLPLNLNFDIEIGMEF